MKLPAVWLCAAFVAGIGLALRRPYTPRLWTLTACAANIIAALLLSRNWPRCLAGCTLPLARTRRIRLER
jgi:hypothetical protein